MSFPVYTSTCTFSSFPFLSHFLSPPPSFLLFFVLFLFLFLIANFYFYYSPFSFSCVLVCPHSFRPFFSLSQSYPEISFPAIINLPPSTDQDYRQTPQGTKTEAKGDSQSSFKEESCEFWAKHSTAESPLLLHWVPHKQKACHNVKCWNTHRTVTARDTLLVDGLAFQH